MKIKFSALTLCLGFSLFQSADSSEVSFCQGNLVGWKREFQGTASYRVFIFQVAPTCSVKISVLPASIDEKNRDTSYKSSSGDIMHGMGYVKFGFEDSTLAISGKYSEVKHPRGNSDSGFNFLLKDRGDRYEEKTLNAYFQWVNEADLTKLKLRWGATGL